MLKLCRLLERLHLAFRQQIHDARDYFNSTSAASLQHMFPLSGELLDEAAHA